MLPIKSASAGQTLVSIALSTMSLVVTSDASQNDQRAKPSISAAESNAPLRSTIITTPTGLPVTGSGLNDSGVVVGWHYDAQLKLHAFQWSAQDGFSELPGILAGRESMATAINDCGVAVGWSVTQEDGYGRHPVLWSDGQLVEDLGVLGGYYGAATAINERGEVAGNTDAPNGDAHGFFWSADTGMIDIGTLGGAYTFAYDINNRGEVVGSSYSADGNIHAFLWSRSAGMLDLGALPGDYYSEARGINDDGVVVGSSEYHAFRWTRRQGMMDLGQPDLGEPDHLFYGAANDVNERGTVVGHVAFTSTSPFHAARWRPGDEPVDLDSGNENSSSALQINTGGSVLANRYLPDQTQTVLWSAGKNSNQDRQRKRLCRR